MHQFAAARDLVSGLITSDIYNLFLPAREIRRMTYIRHQDIKKYGGVFNKIKTQVNEGLSFLWKGVLDAFALVFCLGGAEEIMKGHYLFGGIEILAGASPQIFRYVRYKNGIKEIIGDYKVPTIKSVNGNNHPHYFYNQPNSG